MPLQTNHRSPDIATALPRTVVEICIDDVAGAVAAEREGADRIELCGALSEGGITPSVGTVSIVLDHVRRVGVQVMIRPRGGDFVVSPRELDVMLADIAAIRALAPAPGVVVGFVFGVLTPTGLVDRAAVSRLKTACGTAPTTFHKAFDAIADQVAALADLTALGLDRVLTSGGAETASAGAAALARLVDRTGPGMTILAGGGVRSGNVGALVAETGVSEVHLRAMRAYPGRPPVTAPEEIAAVLRALGRAP